MASYEQGYEDDRFEIAVSQTFHCPICMNVFKDPVMCQRNQHCFCRPCITRHLGNSQTCPTCKEQLTVETISQASRMFKNCWSELNIRCDYLNRGCREIVQLGDLETHVKNCGFSPVLCSNEGCRVEINKRDQTHHETEICEFRKVKCHDCVTLREEIEEMKMNLTTVKDQMEKIEGNFNIVNDKLDQLKDQLTTIPTQIRTIQVVQESSNIDEIKTSKCHIMVAGGIAQGKVLNSTEKFNWTERIWALVKPMEENREGASSVVHDSTVIVTGGWTGRGATDSIETININPFDGYRNWCNLPAKLPYKLHGHSCVVYDGRLIIIGGDDKKECFNSIHEVLLAPPYSSKFLKRMPHRRSFHGSQLFEDKIFICGGTTTLYFGQSIDSVIMYDISKNECKQMSSLPYAVCQMATVSWGDNVIVIGGGDKYGKALNTVAIYNVKTEKSHMLPAMNYKRAGCAAVVVGNTIVVMGGEDERENRLNSVESFSFDRYSWEDLPPMNEARHLATAVSW